MGTAAPGHTKSRAREGRRGAGGGGSPPSLSTPAIQVGAFPPHLLAPVEEALAVGAHAEGLLDLLPQALDLGKAAQVVDGLGLGAVYGADLDPHGARPPTRSASRGEGRAVWGRRWRRGLLPGLRACDGRGRMGGGRPLPPLFVRLSGAGFSNPAEQTPASPPAGPPSSLRGARRGKETRADPRAASQSPAPRAPAAAAQGEAEPGGNRRGQV